MCKKKGLQVAKNYVSTDMSHIPVWHHNNTQKNNSPSQTNISRKTCRKRFKSQNLYLIESSQSIGKRSNFFYTMQANSPIKFKFFLIHGKGDLVKGFYAWSQYEERMRASRNLFLEYAMTHNITSKLHISKAKPTSKMLSLSEIITAKALIAKIKKCIKENNLPEL